MGRCVVARGLPVSWYGYHNRDIFGMTHYEMKTSEQMQVQNATAQTAVPTSVGTSGRNAYRSPPLAFKQCDGLCLLLSRMFSLSSVCRKRLKSRHRRCLQRSHTSNSQLCDHFDTPTEVVQRLAYIPTEPQETTNRFKSVCRMVRDCYVSVLWQSTAR